jgi:hypothetical protein
MPLNDQELAALADYIETVVDCSEEYEDDQFGLHWNGYAFYVERKRSCYKVALGHGQTFVELPR